MTEDGGIRRHERPRGRPRPSSSGRRGVRRTSEEADTKEPSREPASEAYARLARRGYGRSFEARQGLLWCPSCEIVFRAHELVIEETVPVAIDAGRSTAVLCALRCAACGASGTWLVRTTDDEALRLLAGLLRGDTARRSSG
jgi:hypothetical protein